MTQNYIFKNELDNRFPSLCYCVVVSSFIINIQMAEMLVTSILAGNCIGTGTKNLSVPVSRGVAFVDGFKYQ
jgi:hypothetical protein